VYKLYTKNAPQFAILRCKIKKISWRGSGPPPQIPPPVGKGTPPPHTLHPLGASIASPKYIWIDAAGCKNEREGKGKMGEEEKWKR